MAKNPSTGSRRYIFLFALETVLIAYIEGTFSAAFRTFPFQKLLEPPFTPYHDFFEPDDWLISSRATDLSNWSTWRPNSSCGSPEDTGATNTLPTRFATATSWCPRIAGTGSGGSLRGVGICSKDRANRLVACRHPRSTVFQQRRLLQGSFAKRQCLDYLLAPRSFLRGNPRRRSCVGVSTSEATTVQRTNLRRTHLWSPALHRRRSHVFISMTFVLVRPPRLQ